MQYSSYFQTVIRNICTIRKRIVKTLNISHEDKSDSNRGFQNAFANAKAFFEKLLKFTYSCNKMQYCNIENYAYLADLIMNLGLSLRQL